MKNQFRTIALSIGISALLGSALLAGDFGTEKAKIPFGFHVGQSSFAAGEYVVKDIGISGTLQVRDAGTGKSIMLMTQARTYSRDIAPRLVFRRIGDQYFLAQVWMADTSGYVLHKSQLEREMEAGGKEVALAYVPLDRQ